MAHKEQFEFVSSLKQKFPQYFRNSKVLEIGSLNVNGTIRQFFDRCDYLGVDLEQGFCVDLVAKGECLDFPSGSFQTVSSCECFEHNSAWRETFLNMCRMTRAGGFVFFTCATDGRPEHGTTKTKPEDSPFTNDYYKNLTKEDFLDLDLENIFDRYEFSVNDQSHDLYFWGIKKTEDFNTFIITSTIKSSNSLFTSEQKIEQTLSTIESIRLKVKNARIIIIDNSIPDLETGTKQLFEEKVDLFLTYKNNLFTKFVNYNKFNKGLGELIMLENALEEIENRGLIGKRIFKISGRYRLSDDFDISKFDQMFGKYTFRITPWAFTSDNFQTSDYLYFFETRLWSFCSSLWNEYQTLIYEIFDHMIKNNHNIEVSNYYLIPHDSVVEMNPIGLEGYLSVGDYIKE